MRFNDAKVGNIYRVKKALSTYYHTFVNGNDRYAPKGTLLECVEVDSDALSSTYVVLKEDGSHTKNKWRMTDHGSLEFAEAGVDTANMTPRERRAAQCSRQVEKLLLEAEQLRAKLKEVEEKVERKRAEKATLERFASDEEALAHTLAEMLHSDGSPEAILDVLKSHGRTVNL